MDLHHKLAKKFSIFGSLVTLDVPCLMRFDMEPAHSEIQILDQVYYPLPRHI